MKVAIRVVKFAIQMARVAMWVRKFKICANFLLPCIYVKLYTYYLFLFLKVFRIQNIYADYYNNLGVNSKQNIIKVKLTYFI